MASSTLTLVNLADANVVYTLAGQTTEGALYKDATRVMSLPQSLSFGFQIGTPGSQGNDRMTITLRNAVRNATTEVVSVGTCKVEISIPRDGGWTATNGNDLLAELASLLTDANLQKIVAGVIP